MCSINTRLQLEEDLDTADPLRHYFSSADTTYVTPKPIDALFPLQRPAVLKQITQLSFGNNIDIPISISLAVDASPGCGGIAWPAGQVLAEYLVRLGPGFLKGRSVLELGSGTGLVGLIASVLGAQRVWITDQLPLLNIMRQNVLLNELSNNTVVSELNWGEKIPDGIPPIDLILAADCVYYEPAFPLLVQTLSDLVTDDNTEVLFCYKKRRKADKRFFALLRKKFDWIEVMDNPDHTVYSREQIYLMRLKKRR